tara:strand:+ start:1323 stop:1502 length:180 start_codon:yes stop_codon:yes gene_type:complete
MNKIFQFNNKLFALIVFLPITPSIAAMTVFAQSVLIDRRNDLLSVSEHSVQVIDVKRNQ